MSALVMGDPARPAARPSAANAGEWQAIDAGALCHGERVDQIRELMELNGDRLLAHDPVWVAARAANGSHHGPERAVVFELRRDGRLIGYAPFHRNARTLRFAVGELTAYRHRVPSLTLVHDITLAASEETERIRQLLNLFASVAQMSPCEALFLEGVPEQSALFAAAMRAGRTGWIVVPHGPGYEHQFAELPASFEEYERQLGPRSRRSLRYSERKLLEHVGGAMRVRCFAERRDVADFVAAAQAISQKTYQWKLLKLGLRDADGLAARLMLAADQGWMRCYILYCRDEPAAFMLGYVYSGTYHYIDVGYDPAWAKWSVGSVLQIEVVKDLLTAATPPRWIDFSTGFGEHKARFGNMSRKEANILLLPDRARHRVLARAYRLSVAVDQKASAAADALGVKRWLRKWLRRAAVN